MVREGCEVSAADSMSDPILSLCSTPSSTSFLSSPSLVFRCVGRRSSLSPSRWRSSRLRVHHRATSAESTLAAHPPTGTRRTVNNTQTHNSRPIQGSSCSHAELAHLLFLFLFSCSGLAFGVICLSILSAISISISVSVVRMRSIRPLRQPDSMNT